MLSVNKYTSEYISECKSSIDQLLKRYKKLLAQAQNTGKNFQSAIDSFEPAFFENMILALDNYFCHRSRTIEGKDGNALNEVRMLCTSIMHNDGKFCADKTIKYDQIRSILGYRTGDRIKLDHEDFTKIVKKFFAEIEMKYL